VRSAAIANAFQTIVFMIMGLLAFILISRALGGPAAATEAADPAKLVRRGNVGYMEFFTYMFIPLSVAMFPHLFQHWLTAKSAKTFRLTLVAHPLCIMVTWVPCILLGIWATGLMGDVIPPGINPNAVLGVLVNSLTDPVIGGLVTAGILAAIMSSLDSQFVCLGTMFTQDIVLNATKGKKKFSDAQVVWFARGFIVLIVAITYALTFIEPRHIFALGVWCFAGFGSLFPLVFASIYWKRVTKAGAFSAIIATAALWVFFFQDSDFGKNRAYASEMIFGAHPAMFMFFTCALVLVVVSLLTRPPSAETIQKFFPGKKQAAATPVEA
jgi:SSS family solute:Na+ symporter